MISGISATGTWVSISICARSTTCISGVSGDTFSPGLIMRLATMPANGARTWVSSSARLAMSNCAWVLLTLACATSTAFCVVSTAFCEMKFLASNWALVSWFLVASDSLALASANAAWAESTRAFRSRVSSVSSTWPAFTCSPSFTCTLATSAACLDLTVANSTGRMLPETGITLPIWRASSRAMSLALNSNTFSTLGFLPSSFFAAEARQATSEPATAASTTTEAVALTQVRRLGRAVVVAAGEETCSEWLVEDMVSFL